MKNFIRLFALFALMGASAVSAQMPKMTLGTGVDPAFATAYVAKAAGLFEKNGVDVQLNTGPSGSAMVAFLIKNQSQAAIAAEQAGIQNFNLDSNVVVAAETMTADNWWGVVARNTPTMDALKGKRIGVSMGSGSEIFWLAIVKKLNLDAKNYMIVNVDPPEMMAALERGNIDAFVSWEPWLSRATKSVPNSQLLLTNVGIMLPRAYLYINREWAEKNPMAAEAFMRSMVEANEFIRTYRPQAAKYVAAALKLDVADTAAFMQKLTFDLKLDPSGVDHLRMIEGQIRESGKLARPVEWGAFLYPDLLKKVAPAKVSVSPLK
jgi:ABC-type nitrate/sulfonate/bicarbonate transport system substrate-binding protein